MNNSRFAKRALILSVCMLILWAAMGTGTTIAWFTDTTPVVKNTFLIGYLDLDVYYKNDVVTEYTPVENDTPVFNDEALYEPGYTQVVYLKIENKGEIDFNYKLSVIRNSYQDSINTLGTTLHLPKYLRFGVVFGADEPSLTRDVARALTEPETMEALLLNQYSREDTQTVPVGGVRYAALVVFMPEEVGNEANYMAGAKVPMVELGLTVYAQQAGTELPG